MENYTTRIGKILTTQKLPDRFIKAAVHHPKSPSEEEHGTLIFLVEILSPWFPSTEIGNTIIDTTVKEYYKASKYADTLTRFEEALKKVNEKLAEMAARGVNDWIGNINCTIIALKRNNLYVSHSGNTQVYLFRDKNLSEVTEDVSDRSSSPISTFITITSGSLIKGDRILLTNQQLLDFTPLQSLREIINYTDVINSIHQIGKILRRKNVKNINCILFELTTEKELARLSENQYLEEDTVYLDQEPETWWGTFLKEAKPKIATELDREGKRSGRIWERFLIKAHDGVQKVTPHVKRITTNIGHGVLKSWYGLRGKSTQKISRKRLSKQKDYFVQKREMLRRKKPGIANFFKNFLLNTTSGIKTLFLLQNRRKLYITLIILFLLVFGTSLFFTLNKNWSNAENIKIERTIDTTKNNIEEAKTLIGANNFSEARKLLIESFENLQKHSNNPKYQKEVKSLLAKLTNYIDITDQTTRYSSIKKLSGITTNLDTKEILFLNDIFYYVDSGNTLYGVSDNEKSKIADLPAKIETVKTFINIENQKIIFYTQDLRIYQYDFRSEKFARLDASGGWEKTNQITTYNTNIYLLGESGQIFKHTKVALGYSKARNLILENQLPKNQQALDFVIDGNVYLLFKGKNYQVNKFYNGRLKDDFELEDTNSGLVLSGPQKIYTSKNLSSLYVLENNITDFDGNKINRILEFSKDGAFIKQHKFSSGLGKIFDFAVNQKLHKIYILFDSQKLYSLDQ